MLAAHDLVREGAGLAAATRGGSKEYNIYRVPFHSSAGSMFFVTFAAALVWLYFVALLGLAFVAFLFC